jgi:hypothetical protein
MVSVTQKKAARSRIKETCTSDRVRLPEDVLVTHGSGELQINHTTCDVFIRDPTHRSEAKLADGIFNQVGRPPLFHQQFSNNLGFIPGHFLSIDEFSD